MKIITQISIIKTLYANFKSLPIKQAIKLPIIIGRHTSLDIIRNGIIIDAPIKPAMITFGLGGSPDLLNYESRKNYLGIKQGGKIMFKGKAHFAPHVSCLALGSNIIFGAGFSSNNGCRFSSCAGIEFGEKCLLGGNVVVRDSDGHKVFDIDKDGNKTQEHINKAPVIIGNHVWIANNVSILKGVTIGSDTIVSYGSIVIKAIQGEHQIIAGYPAKCIKQYIDWER